MKIYFITDQVDNKLVYILKQFLYFSVLDIDIEIRKVSNEEGAGNKEIYYLANFGIMAQRRGIFIHRSGDWDITSFQKIDYFCKGLDFFVWEGFSKAPSHIENDCERVYLNFDLLGQAFYQLVCYQEYILERSKKRAYSNAKKISPDTDTFEIPNVNTLFLVLERLIADMFGIECKERMRYSQGKQFGIILTHDVDVIKKSMKSRIKHVFHGMNRIIKLIQTGKFGNVPEEIYNTFGKFIRSVRYNNIDYLSALEEKNGVRSVLNMFVMNKRNKSGFAKWFYNPDYNIVHDMALAEKARELADSNFEVGIHGSYSSGCDNFLLQEELESLDGIIKRKILGGRQHFLDYSVLHTPQVFQNAGVEYDTTVGFRDINGFRAGACFPYYLYSLVADHETNVLEMPLVIMDGVLFDHLDGTKESAWQSVAGILEKIKNMQGCGSIVWHQHVFNNRDYPFWEEVYLMIIAWVKDNNGVLLSPGELNEFWRSKKKNNIIHPPV